MQRRFAVVVGTVALGFAGMFGVGSSAVAAETAGMGIQRGFFTAYEHDDFKGGSVRFEDTNTDLSGASWDGEGGRVVNDNFSSVRNQTDRDVFLWEHSGCSGIQYLSRRNSEDSDLNNNNMENRASCVKFG